MVSSSVQVVGAEAIAATAGCMRAVRLRISMRLQLKSDRLGWCAALRKARRASGGASSTRDSAGRLVFYRPLDNARLLSPGAPRRRAAPSSSSDAVRWSSRAPVSFAESRAAQVGEQACERGWGGSPLRRRHGVGRCRRPTSSGEVFFVGSTRAAASSSGTRSPAVRRRCLRGATRSERPQMIEKKPPTSFVICARVASMA